MRKAAKKTTSAPPSPSTTHHAISPPVSPSKLSPSNFNPVISPKFPEYRPLSEPIQLNFNEFEDEEDPKSLDRAISTPELGIVKDQPNPPKMIRVLSLDQASSPLYEEKATRKDSISTMTSSSRAKAVHMLGSEARVAIDRPAQRRGTEDLESLRFKQMKFSWPSDYIFGAPDSSENICMTDSNQIRHATLFKLIEHLTHEGFPEHEFLTDFLLTFRSFTNPRELMDLLIKRLDVPNPTDLTDEEDLQIFEKCVRKKIRARVVNVIKIWSEMHWDHFQEDPQLVMMALKATVEKDKSEPVFLNLAHFLEMQQEGGARNVQTPRNRQPPESHTVDMKLLSSSNSNMNMMAFHPEEIARQMTLIEHELYMKIPARELLGQRWTGKDKQEYAPQILAFIQRFNKVSSWVTSTLVHVESTKSRAELLSRFIEVASHCRHLNNFNGVLEIISGLHSGAIHRLKKTWAAVSKDKLKIYDELVELVSDDGTYSKMRAQLSKSMLPCIPYLGMYLTFLTFLEDGNPSKVLDLINFDKWRRIAAVIKEISLYQKDTYNFNVVPILPGYLLAAGEYIDQEELYNRSLEIEPRDKGKKKDWRKSEVPKKKPGEISSPPSPMSPKSPSGRKSPVPEIQSPPLSPRSSESMDEKPEREEEQIPFEMLVGFLKSGKSQNFENYFDSKEIYQAEKNQSSSSQKIRI
eukprot:TRINITY_DN3847_c0_g1_i2.p1 TRINITY_DN3847_c0_g1~~TRINITY_DN3847_c0_g1_i2.p1  ORF type:complete len:691 (-),score=233.60 TRINITY_DN3847_c0_g1_i2:34-2106(-)